jgi:hypothetical protein
MQLPAHHSHLNFEQSGATQMADNCERDEIRIPIPGTPVVLVESSERKKTALKSEADSEKEAELDEALAESFPASDSPAAVHPEPTKGCNKQNKDKAA